MTEQKKLFGLRQETIAKINAVFMSYPQIEAVFLYGSRAKGNYRPGSDIDLVIRGEHLTYKQLLAIENKLDDLLLPYKIDLSLLHHIDNMDLLDHINRVKKIFYTKHFSR
jgi:uncharacterized protein